MRARDLEKLNITYENDEGPSHTTFSKYLGINTEFIKNFDDKIFHSLDEKNYGIDWMVAYKNLDFKRRILISDQLVQSVKGIELNLIESKLHILKLYEAWDAEVEKLKFSVTLTGKTPHFQHPERNKPIDDLDGYIATIHLKGIYSSLCSAIDCMSSVIVGVMGLEIDILSAGYPSLKSHLRDHKKFSYSKGIQKDLLQEIEKFEKDSGPNGWLKWIFDYRNMTVHRGRRMLFGTVLADGWEDGKVKVKAVNLLTSNPRVSEVESMKDQIIEPLSEDARVTVEKSLESCLQFIELVINYLDKIWEARKIDVHLIEQPPKAQWSTIRNGHHDKFVGFNTGTVNNQFSSMAVHPSFIKRLKASALDGENIHKWKIKK